MRFERKYRIDELSLSLIKQAIRLHPAGFRKIYPDRQINNIYFDTPNFETYKDNVKGIAIRKKYRVRWYGEEVKSIKKPKFEIKNRHNEIGTKDISPVDFEKWEDIPQLIRQVNAINNNLLDLQPVLLSSYNRAYFGTSDERFRITIDWNLRYHPMLGKRYFFRKYRMAEENVYILELKYDHVWDDVIDPITQFLPFRRTKNSKYVNGVNMCYWN